MSTILLEESHALSLVGRDTTTGALVRCDAYLPDWSPPELTLAAMTVARYLDELSSWPNVAGPSWMGSSSDCQTSM